MSSTRFSHFDDTIAEHLSRGAAPAAAWGVFESAGLVHANSSALPVDTAFRIASCTKSFTAAALLSLRDEGLVALDDPITRFVPQLDLRGLPSAVSRVPTLRMLLTMSAGLPTDDPWADRQENMGSDEFDAVLAAGVRFEAEPGTRFAYSNLGYALVGRAIEVAAGRPYRAVVEQRLLTPLGLSSTGFDAGVQASGGIATGHRRHAGEWEPLSQTGPGAFSAIGGLYSTIADLAHWASWLARCFDTDNGADDAVLSAASRREMQQLHRLDQSVTAHPTGYGYGLFVEQYSPTNRVVSHSGGYPGFSAHMRWSIEHQFGVVAFENATYSRVSEATTSAFNALLAERTPAQPPATASSIPGLWPETRAAQRVVTELLTATEPLATPLDATVFSENVELDDPLERRSTALVRALADIGGLLPDAQGASLAERSDGPAHLVWHLPGQTGRLSIEIRLTPEATPRVQTLQISVDRLGR